MAKKDLFIKIRVNNSGLDFEDDVDMVILTVPAEVENYRVQNAIESADKELRKEDDDGHCLYEDLGYNYTSLMDKACEKFGTDWSWRTLYPNIDFEIK